MRKKTIAGGLCALALISSMQPGCAGYLPTIHTGTTEDLDKRLAKEEFTKNGIPDRYALLVRGDDEYRHAAGISIAYRALLENGYLPKNIYVLAGKGRQTFFHPTDGAATRKNLMRMLYKFSAAVDDKDTLLIFMTDHGEKMDPSPYDEAGTVSRFIMGRDRVDELDLEWALGRINPEKGILVFDFCMDGGFSERLGKGQYIAVSSSNPVDPSHAIEADAFSGWFFRAFTYGAGSDKNNDGNVSIREAFEFAKDRHIIGKKGEDTPMLISQRDAGKTGL